VVVNDLLQKQQALEQLVKEIEASGRKSIAVFADVSKDIEVQALVNRAVEVFGGLDVVSLCFNFLPTPRAQPTESR
jgi:NAD(P)-dependent dehydrogenase (short-subunit alcohol dehydrogenase family)